MSTIPNSLDPEPVQVKPIATSVNFFEDEFKESPASATAGPSGEPNEVTPAVGAPLSKEETSYLREILRRQMQAEAEAETATTFLKNNPSYFACPENFQVIQKILLDSKAEFSYENLVAAYRCAAQEGLLRSKNDGAAEDAFRGDKIAAFERERQAEIERLRRLDELNNNPPQTVRTGIEAGHGIEPEETIEGESDDDLAAQLARMPLDAARNLMLQKMREQRVARGTEHETHSPRRIGW